MKILLIHQAFASPDEPGGTRHYELARHCVTRGHGFTIVSSNINYGTGRRITKGGKPIEEQELEGVRLLRAYTYSSIHRSFVWRVFSFLSFMFTSIMPGLRSGPVDLVMGTSPPIFQAVSAWIVATIRRRPFLLEIRDLWPEFAIDIGVLKIPALIQLSRWLELFLYARAEHILINSPAYRDYLINKGVPDSKISLIANGVDPDMFDPGISGKRFRGEWNLNDKFVVTYVGALGMANDIPTILRAANRLQVQSEIHFVLVGDGKERSKLEDDIRHLQLKNITFVGPISKSEVPEALAASDVCVATLKDIPMFRTTYPNKVFDYMAAGKPIILAIDGVIRKVVEASGGGIFVPPGNDVALADAIYTLSHQHQRLREMGALARSYVVKHFNRHRQAENFLELLQWLTTSRVQ